MVHEPGQLLLVMDDAQKVDVIREPHGRAKLEWRDLQCPSDDPDDDFVESVGNR